MIASRNLRPSMISKIEAPWLVAPETVAVITALEAARPGGSRFVGGCVRNTLRGAPVDDIDIATQLVPNDTIVALEAAGIRAIPTGVDHGTVTAVKDSVPFEITTLRRDVETDGRRAVVAFTEEWAEDAERRDFRLNAIYAGPDGMLHEIVPGSIDDAIAGRVIFIGDADARLREDYLRILRFFRFNAWYGSGMDADGLAACARQKDGLQKIAAERIWKELKKMLAAPDPSKAASAMAGNGIAQQIGISTDTGLLPAFIALEAQHNVAPDPMRRLMALVLRRKSDVGRLAERLRLSNAEASRLNNWAASDLPAVTELDRRSLRVQLYAHGAEAVRDRAMVEAAQGSGAQLADILKIADTYDRPVFPIGGDEALAAGYEGRGVGDALRRVEQVWIESDFSLGREALLALL